MTTGLFTIEFFQDANGTSPVEAWMESQLTKLELAALLSAFENVLSHRGIGACATEWGKQIGGGIFGFRVRHTAAEIKRMFVGARAGVEAGEGGPGGERVLLRVFCYAYGSKVVLLLSGYDKAADVSKGREQREIALARKRLVELQERMAREGKARRRRGGRA